MPTLRIKNMLPEGERFTLSVDGVPQTGTVFSVPESFRLRIEQYRLSTSAEGTAGMLGTFLTTLALGGRKEWGSELSSPYYAIWEGTCQMRRDGEIELWLKEEGMEASFAPWSDTVSFLDVESRTGGRDPVQVGHWALMNAPFLLFASAICLFLIFGVGVYGIDPTQEQGLWIPKIIFLVFPLCMLLNVWKNALRPFLKRKNVDWMKRAGRRLAVQGLVTAALAGAAVFEICALWVFGFTPAMFTCFPAAVLLILHLLATTNFLEGARRSGIRGEELESRLRWMCRLRVAACVSFAAIVLGLILPLAGR